ncbi:hypothetical protein D3C81_1911860 [compost metagenome]
MGLSALPDNLLRHHGIELVAVFQFAELPLIAIESDLHLPGSGFADDRLDIIEGFVHRCPGRWPWFDPACPSAA